MKRKPVAIKEELYDVVKARAQSSGRKIQEVADELVAKGLASPEEKQA